LLFGALLALLANKGMAVIPLRAANIRPGLGGPTRKRLDISWYHTHSI
jgi:hypothetical protein